MDDKMALRHRRQGLLHGYYYLSETVSSPADVVANRPGAQGFVDGHDISQELDAQAIGHQAGPLALQEQPLGCGPLGAPLGRRTERVRLVGLTVALLQTGTLHGERPENGAKRRVMHTLAVAELPVLGAVMQLAEIRVRLTLHDHLLQRLEHPPPFGQGEAQRYRGEVLAFHTGNVLGNFLAIVSDADHLYVDCIARFLPPARTRAVAC
jgi:hypothetical protein